MKSVRSTKDRILDALHRQPKISINELAEAVGINAISVRHHLTNLTAEGLITAEEERHGVGRPRLIYSLTQDGLERFPTKYLRLTTRLLAQMKETLPAPEVSKLFSLIAEEIADEYSEQIKDLGIEERLVLIQKLLAQEGFTVEWEKKGAEYQIHEITCPYYQISAAHPEVCMVDQTLISKMLALPAKRTQCVLDGNAHCTYVVSAGNRN
ncbi:MAG: TrmB family transcriptional regulator [Anaerolineaceae bacterium]|nr:MAG: TrmB family transcriptional regulator [Anaerolineaceae bacterium]